MLSIGIVIVSGIIAAVLDYSGASAPFIWLVGGIGGAAAVGVPIAL